jgi:drug/metabolite transporter (DMT)-like permease
VSPRPSSLKLILLFSLMVGIWSLSFVIVKNATQEVPPVILSTMRAIGSAIVMLPIAWWDARRHPHKRWDWRDAPKLFLAASLGITLNQLLYMVGLSRTSVAHASIVMALNPATVYALALLMGLEQPAIRRFLGMAIALGGIAVLQLAKSGDSVATVGGDLLVFIGSSGFAGYTVLGKSLTHKYGTIYVTAISFVVGAVSLLPVAYFSGQRIELASISGAAWLSLVYLIVMHSVLCYLIFYYLLTHSSASRVSLFSYVQPVLASLFAWVLLAEPITAPIVGGGLLVGAGVWLAERRT